MFVGVAIEAVPTDCQLSYLILQMSTELASDGSSEATAFSDVVWSENESQCRQAERLAF